MAISDGYKHNLGTLLAAANNNDLGLLECTDKKTGATVIAIVAGSRDPDTGEVTMTPVGKMFDGDPYEELDPPT